VPAIITLNGFNLYERSIYGGYGKEECVFSIDEGLDGGYITAGKNLTPPFDSKFQVFKTDVNGSIEWQYRWPSSYSAKALCVKTTSDNHYIAGGYYSYLDPYSGRVCQRILIVKLNSDGERVWEKNHGELRAQNACFDIEECENGSYIAACQAGFYEEPFMDTHISLFWISQDGTQWNFLKKVNFEEEDPFLGVDRALAVKQTADGNYIVTGACIRLWNMSHAIIQVPRCFIAKINSNLDPDPIWFKIFGDETPDSAARGHDIQIANDGGYIVTGFYSDIYNDTIYKAWLLKTNENGNPEWGDHGYIYGDNSNSSIMEQVSLHGDNHYVATGSWSREMDGSIYMIRVDLDGNLVAEGEIGELYDIAYSLMPTWGRNFVIAGRAYNGYDKDSLIAHVRHTGNDQPGAPIINGATTGPEDYELDFTFCATDPDVDLLQYIVDWGDDMGEELIPGPFESGEVATASHSWSEPGEYEIRAKARDLYPDMFPGEESEWSDLWTVEIYANDPPYDPYIDGPWWGFKETEYDYTFETTDPEGDDIYYQINWDDEEVTDWLGPYPSGYQFTLSYTWSTWGIKTVSAKAKDIWEAESGCSSHKTIILPFKHGVAQGTLINMAPNGPAPQPIESLRVGDLISSYDPTTQEVTVAEVIAVLEYTENLPDRFVFNGNLEVTTEHTLYIDQMGWMEAIDAHIGHNMLENIPQTPFINQVPIISKEPSSLGAPIYNLVVRPLYGEAVGYFANGILVGGYV
jgi:hypothetical protein